MLQTAVDGPLALYVIGCTDVSLATRIVVRCKERIELASMVLQGSSPLSTTIYSSFLHIILRRVSELREDVVYHLPVYQVLRLHDWRTRHQMHSGAHHIEIITYSNDIHIRHIRPQDRVCKILLEFPPIEVKELAALHSLEYKIEVVLTRYLLLHSCRESLEFLPAAGLGYIDRSHLLSIYLI